MCVCVLDNLFPLFCLIMLILILMAPCPCDCQESRIGKAVEVMILHVENLRRMYTKEHAELLELREALVQNERSFGSQTERGSGVVTGAVEG